jgi:hypothetical protein
VKEVEAECSSVRPSVEEDGVAVTTSKLILVNVSHVERHSL